MTLSEWQVAVFNFELESLEEAAGEEGGELCPVFGKEDGPCDISGTFKVSDDELFSRLRSLQTKMC